MTDEQPANTQFDPIARWSLLIALCPLLPIPFIDFFLEPVFARFMFKPIVPKFQARHFVTTGNSYCLGCLLSIILWPVFKLVKTIGFILRFKSYVETFQYWFYKAHITQYAMENFPKGHWDNPEAVKDFAVALDIFLRKSEMKSLFSKNLQKLIGEHGMWTTLKLLFWTTQLAEGTEAVIEQNNPHLPTHTPEIRKWLEAQEQKMLVSKELDREFDV